MVKQRSVRIFLLLVVLAVWVWSAINPLHPEAWLLENILVVVGLPLGIFLSRYFHLSIWSQSLMAAFLVLHLIGAHYTYAETPFGYPLGEWLGTERNMYDRLVHFAFGLLLAFPIREMFFRVARVRGVWGYVFPLDITLSLSALFEIVEWAVVMGSGSEAGVAFLATQGDAWDPVLDMLLAASGALTTLALIGITNWRYSEPFREEVRESLRVGQETYRSSSEVRLKEVLEDRRRKRRERQEEKKRRMLVRKREGVGRKKAGQRRSEP
jgi:putative membrane protein